MRARVIKMKLTRLQNELAMARKKKLGGGQGGEVPAPSASGVEAPGSGT
jgi:hypothetical protein